MRAVGTPGKPSTSAKRGAIISGVVTVLILAAVIVGVAALSSPTESKPETSLGLAQSGDQAQQYAQQAEAALASGDTTAAVAFATTALKTDPNNTTALRVIRRARTSQSGGSSNGDSNDDDEPSGGTQTPDPDKGFTSRLSKFRGLLPKSFAEYFLGDVTTTKREAQVAATPISAGQEANQLIWTVHETDSKAEAQQFITSVSKTLYANDASALTIDGAKAYFGTDGTRFATVAYVRGIYVFEVLITGNGTQPKNLKALAQKAAKAFADAPPK